jgi:hypothetical protein
MSCEVWHDVHTAVTEVLRDVVRQRDRRALVVAAPAELRDVHHGGARFVDEVAQYVVCAVAVRARGRHLVAARERPAVEAGGVPGGFVLVAHPTLHRLHVGSVRELGVHQVDMAGRAVLLAVHRGRVDLRIDVDGDLLPVADADHVGILVAAQAVLGVLRRHGGREREAQRQRAQRTSRPAVHGEEPAHAMTTTPGRDGATF